MAIPTLAILLADCAYPRAHTAMMLAASAAALGRPVILFATNSGAHLLRANWSSPEDDTSRARGVAGIGELRDAVRALGVRLMVCETGLRLCGIEAAELCEDVEICGMATFLADVAQGQLIAL